MTSYTQPNVSRSNVNRAGKVLATGNGENRDQPQQSARHEARQVVNHWRSSHSYPLFAMRMTLSARAKRIDPSALVAQRLKRLSSIEGKLRRFPKMELARMQDLGGCRAVLSSATHVDRLVALYERSTAKDPNRRAEYVDKNDYIQEPKPNGYRGVHLIYKYRSSAQPMQIWNGHRIEIQVRSTLQHAWATAVETIDTFTSQALKFTGTGSSGWDRFFALMGSVLALEEHRPTVPGTPNNLGELRDEIGHLVEELKVRKTIGGLQAVVRQGPKVKDSEYFLVSLERDTSRVSVKKYSKNQLPLAQEEYLAIEEQNEGKPGFQACLVSASSVRDLRRAFPNYYLNVSKKFMRALDSLIVSPTDRI